MRRFCASPMRRFCATHAQILRIAIRQSQGVAVGCFAALLAVSLLHMDKASGLQTGNVVFNGSPGHFAALGQPLDARVTLARLSVVVVRDPVEHDLSGRL